MVLVGGCWRGVVRASLSAPLGAPGGLASAALRLLPLIGFQEKEALSKADDVFSGSPMGTLRTNSAGLPLLEDHQQKVQPAGVGHRGPHLAFSSRGREPAR